MDAYMPTAIPPFLLGTCRVLYLYLLQKEFSMHRVMHKVSIFNRNAAVLILLFMVGPATTFAQDNDALDVVITAARTAESELSTAASVIVITSEEIRESGEQSLVGILDKLA